MAATRRAGGDGRIASVIRIVVALALLGALWFGTVDAVGRGSRDAEQRRLSDRLAVAKGFATSVRDWLDAGRSEASSLSRAVGVAPASDALGELNTFIAQGHTFTRDAIVFSAGTVVAATGRYAALIGLRPRACVRSGESQTNLLAELVARTGSTPALSPVFDVPGACRPAVAIVAGAGQFVVVVVGDVADLSARLAAGGRIADTSAVGARSSSDVSLGGTRIVLITPALDVDPSTGIVAAPAYAPQLIRTVAGGGTPITRESIGPGGDAAVIAALAPLGNGWFVLLEQDAALYDIPVQERPAGIVASVLTIAFAIVFALIAFFDIRRRRAHRRAEVAKNALFSIAGHELRTPLTVLNGFTDMLSKNWTQLDDERRRSLVDRMVPQARRLTRLVERLLVAASIEAETHVRPDMQEMDPAPVIVSVAEEFQLESPLHTFVLDLSQSAHIFGDPAAFEQIMRHLVENAVKYSPGGGHVWIRVVADKRNVHVVIEDEGVGLPSDHSRIFESFAQGESVTTRVHDEGGVGLGLFIVRTLAGEMGGYVRAQPREEKGSRFVLSLRRANESSPATPDRGLVTPVQPADRRSRPKRNPREPSQGFVPGPMLRTGQQVRSAERDP
jgi:signal transduction histidine kinase